MPRGAEKKKDGTIVHLRNESESQSSTETKKRNTAAQYEKSILTELTTDYKSAIKSLKTILKDRESTLGEEGKAKIDKRIGVDYMILSKLYGVLNDTAAQVDAEDNAATHFSEAGMDGATIERTIRILKNGPTINVREMVSKRKEQNNSPTRMAERKDTISGPFAKPRTVDTKVGNGDLD